MYKNNKNFEMDVLTLKNRKILKRVQNDGKRYAYTENKHKAFTLAEVLIVLVVIGVISAVVIPTLKQNLDAKVNSSRQANIAYKVTQAMDTMKSLGLLENTYASTDDFVDVLQKYLKINKRCKANEIADCWGTDTVIAGNGEKYYISDATTGDDIGYKNNTSNNVGLILADGATLILTYDQNAASISATTATEPSPKSLPVGFGKNEWFNYYTTNSTAPIDFVMDVNGGRKPNTEATGSNSNYDIRPFRIAHFAVPQTACEAMGGHDITKEPPNGNASLKGKCLINIGTSYNAKGTVVINGTATTYLNYWEGAKAACAAIGSNFRLASPTEFGSNGVNYTSNVGWFGYVFGTNGLYNYSADDKEQFGIPTGGEFWSSTDYRSDLAYTVFLDNGLAYGASKYMDNINALCLGTL